MKLIKNVFVNLFLALIVLFPILFVWGMDTACPGQHKTFVWVLIAVCVEVFAIVTTFTISSWAKRLFMWSLSWYIAYRKPRRNQIKDTLD